MQSRVPVAHSRNILCIFPTYTPSFGTFAHAFELVPGVRAFMPPQGLLIVAAYLPKRWQVRFIDENIERADPSDFAWADVVFVGGMHIQLSQIRDIQHRAKSCGKLTVLGGSAVSSSPETYPEFDYLHLGEIGDATDELIATLDDSLRTAGGPTAVRDAVSGCPCPASHYRSTMRSRSRVTSSARSSSPAVARIGASFATFRPSMAASRASKRQSNFSPNSTPSSPNPIIRP